MTPIVLTIAGSDPSGGAGLETDLKVIERLGGYGMAVATALTVQDPDRVHEVGILPVDRIAKRLSVVLDGVRPHAVKIGMLGDELAVSAVAKILRERARGVPIVLDPVIRSTSGKELLTPEGESRLISELLPIVHCLTPNLAEARALLRRADIDAPSAAEALLSYGPHSVVVTGGDVAGPEAIDHAAEKAGRKSFRAPRRSGDSPHGTGCAFASAIAVHIARGIEPFEAIALAKSFVLASIDRAIRLPPGAAGRASKRSVLVFSDLPVS